MNTSTAMPIMNAIVCFNTVRDMAIIVQCVTFEMQLYPLMKSKVIRLRKAYIYIYISADYPHSKLDGHCL